MNPMEFLQNLVPKSFFRWHIQKVKSSVSRYLIFPTFRQKLLQKNSPTFRQKLQQKTCDVIPFLMQPTQFLLLVDCSLVTSSKRSTNYYWGNVQVAWTGLYGLFTILNNSFSPKSGLPRDFCNLRETSHFRPPWRHADRLKVQHVTQAREKRFLANLRLPTYFEI